MRYFRILFLFGLVLFCGSVASHANTFHAGALDPACNPTLTECGVGFSDIGQTFPVNLSAAQCTSSAIQPPLTGLPDDPTTYGCFLGFNETGSAITSITLHFLSIPGVTGCDNALPGLNYGPAFANSSCGVDPEGGFDLSFSGGPGVGDGHSFIILEEGVDPTMFVGSTSVETTPEPDSLLLLSTGTMMMGLYLTGRTRLFAFLKK